MGADLGLDVGRAERASSGRLLDTLPEDAQRQGSLVLSQRKLRVHAGHAHGHDPAARPDRRRGHVRAVPERAEDGTGPVRCAGAELTPDSTLTIDAVTASGQAAGW